MAVKQCHKPPMTENGWNPTYKNCDDWGVHIVLPTLIMKPLNLESTINLGHLGNQGIPIPWKDQMAATFGE